VSTAILSEIHIYPVKSAQGISLPEAEVLDRGFRWDRRWMLVNGEGRFLTQRELPRMTLMSVTLGPGGLQVNAPGMPELGLPLELHDGDRTRVQVWNDQVEAVVAEPAVNAWFRQFLKTDCSLVFMPDDVLRRANPEYAEPDDVVSFADGFAFLLISQESLDDLNQRLKQPLGMRRFRPNLVVKGCESFAEDTWRRIRVGGIEFDIVKPCPRCVITTVDETTGKPAKEPLTTLASYRSQPGKGVLFGQNLIQRGRGILRVGDKVEVLRHA